VKWNLASPNAASVATLQRALNISAPAARVLCARGFVEPEAARKFLKPTTADLYDPFLLAGMKDAADRLALAIRRQEPILLYGDYDVDGTSALVVLKKAIDLAGGKATCFVPHRIKDGYGMKTDVVDDAAANGVRLIISVDTGIRANAVVAHASGLGIDVIVTDHHLPESELPPALAVVNPNRPDCTYPEKNLCGAGVALKLADAMMQTLGWERDRRERLIDSFLKLVAIATVADVVALTGENRIIVKRGLEGLRDVRNPGMRALLDVSGIPAGKMPSARDIAFGVAPRINAAGRMDSATHVLELFTTESEDRARELAAALHDHNSDRRQTQDDITQLILQQCVENPVTDADAALVFAGEGWHRGVVGIVASKIVDRYHRPVIVLGIDNGVAHGSGRSIRQFHLLDALEAMPELFTKFGGHRQAAGVTIAAERIEEFRERFRAHAAGLLTPDDFIAVMDIDAEISLREINDQSVAELLDLAPFGFGNPPPSLLLRGVRLASPVEIKNEKHVFLKLAMPSGRPLRLKAWNFAERAGELTEGTLLDLAVQFEDDAYSASRGYSPWQTILRDVRPAAQEVLVEKAR
jgi:single-stranded-DNA-specific exonuclease